MSTSHEAEAAAEPLDLVEDFDKAVERLRQTARAVHTSPYDRNIAAVSYSAEALRQSADLLFDHRLFEDSDDDMIIRAAVGVITNSSEDLAYLGFEIAPIDDGYDFFPDEAREQLFEAVYSHDPSVFYREDYDEFEDDQPLDDSIMLGVLLNKFELAYKEMVDDFEAAVLAAAAKRRRQENKAQFKVVGAAFVTAAVTSAAVHLMKDRRH